MIEILMYGDPPPPNPGMSLPVWFDVTAMTVNGVFGAAVARSRNAPIYGTLLAGILVGLGGGMARDVFLGLEPVAIASWFYIPAVILGSIVGALFFGRIVGMTRPFLLINGITLGFLVSIGAQRALAYDAPIISAMFLGVVTASFGGIAADAMTGHRAAIAKQSHWLASALTVGAILFVLASVYLNFWLAVAVCVIAVTVLRYVSTQRNWPSPYWPGESITTEGDAR